MDKMFFQSRTKCSNTYRANGIGGLDPTQNESEDRQMAERPEKPLLYVDTGNRLREMREALGYGTLRDFAAALDVPEDRMGTYERGISLLQMPTALLIKQRYGVTLEWIYDGDPRGMPHGLYEDIKARQQPAEASGRTSEPREVSAAKPASSILSGVIQRTKAAREESGLSQSQLANMLDVSVSAYQKYEQRSPLPHELIPSFCVIVQKDPAWLLTGALWPSQFHRSPRRDRPR